jgi:hypothetical protein
MTENKKFYRLHSKSFKNHKASNYKELWGKMKEKGYQGMLIEAHTEFKSVEDNKFHAIFSTASEDRHGEIVYQDWDLKHFKKNPVYIDSHNYSSIEFIIGKVEKLKVKDNKLEGDIVFCLDNPRGELAYKMANGGFLNTSSVGFVPKQFDDKGNIIKSELLEISGVVVPANAEALYEKYVKQIKSDSKEGEGECGDCVREVESPEDKIKKAIEKEIDIKKRAIQRIVDACFVVSKFKKVETPEEDRADINHKINVAIRNLLKLKK